MIDQIGPAGSRRRQVAPGGGRVAIGAPGQESQGGILRARPQGAPSRDLRIQSHVAGGSSEDVLLLVDLLLLGLDPLGPRLKHSVSRIVNK